jgi:hypothetical protein
LLTPGSNLRALDDIACLDTSVSKQMRGSFDIRYGKPLEPAR